MNDLNQIAQRIFDSHSNDHHLGWYLLNHAVKEFNLTEDETETVIGNFGRIANDADEMEYDDTERLSFLAAKLYTLGIPMSDHGALTGGGAEAGLKEGEIYGIKLEDSPMLKTALEEYIAFCNEAGDIDLCI